MADKGTPAAGSDRPSSAELWNQREAPAAKKGFIIAPIWVLIGVTVILAGVLFGQMFASSTAAPNEAAATPAPQSSVASFGSGSSAGSSRQSSVFGGGGTRTGSPSPVPSPQPTIDPVLEARIRADAAVARAQWPNLAQIVTGPDQQVPAVGGGSVPQPVDSPGIVEVYSRDSSPSPSPGFAGQAGVLPVPMATAEGDNGRSSETGNREFQRMPTDTMTPAPVTVGEGTRILAQIDVPTDSDLLGPVKAHIMENVCDPRTGALAFPYGSWLNGQLDPVATKTQRHLSFAWTNVEFPDLTKRALLGGVVTEDEEGHSGVAGRVDSHSWAIFRDTLIGSVAGAGGAVLTALAQKQGTSPPEIVLPGQTTPVGTSSNVAIDIPEIEVGRSVPFELVLSADYQADKPYNEPGWVGCRSSR
jgi:hypothetical protein